MIPIVPIFVECVNGKDEGMFWVARKVAGEAEDERVLHRLWSQVWINLTTTLRKGGLVCR